MDHSTILGFPSGALNTCGSKTNLRAGGVGSPAGHESQAAAIPGRRNGRSLAELQDVLTLSDATPQEGMP
jgi:hypothetical protein